MRKCRDTGIVLCDFLPLAGCEEEGALVSGVSGLFFQYSAFDVISRDCPGDDGGLCIGGVADCAQMADFMARILVCFAQWYLLYSLFYVYCRISYRGHAVMREQYECC